MSADRIHWCDNGIPQPGKCSVCGSTDHAGRKFVAFGVNIKYYGHFILCNHCVNNVLLLPGLDFVPRTDLNAALEMAENYRGKLEPALAAVNNLRASIDSLLDGVFAGVPGPAVSDSVEVSSHSEPDLLSLIESDSDAVSDSKSTVGLFD